MVTARNGSRHDEGCDTIGEQTATDTPCSETTVKTDRYEIPFLKRCVGARSLTSWEMFIRDTESRSRLGGAGIEQTGSATVLGPW